MADSADITKTTDLPKQEPRQPSPVESQSSRVESPVTPGRVERPPTPPPSSDPIPAVPIPAQPSAASDAIIAQMLAAPVSSGSKQLNYSDIEAFVTDIFKNVTVNGYATTFQNGNLDIQIPAPQAQQPAPQQPAPQQPAPQQPAPQQPAPQQPAPQQPAPQQAAPQQPAPQQSTPNDLSTTSTPPPPPVQPATGPAIGTITPATAANMAAGNAQQAEPPPGPKPGEEGFFYGREENRRPGESYVSQVSREKREASGEAPPEEPFVYGREENRRPGESYVSQVSREKKGDTAPPPAASTSEGVYTEDRPQDQAAANQQSNMVGDRRMGDYGRRENRREGESHSDQVTREHGEDRDQRREQRRERQAQRDRFDPMSRRQQRGESREEFRERKEKIESFDQKAQEALRNGDTTLLGKGYVPVLFSRADEKRKVLLRLDVTHSTVIEGAAGNERAGSLPSDDAYYLGGGGGSCFGLGLFVKTVGEGENATQQVWVSPGSVGGKTPPGFGEEGKNIANGGSGQVWAEVNINDQTGEIVSVAVDGGGQTPTNSDTAKYLTLGSYEYDGKSAKVTNWGCGSVNVTVCRNWFTNQAPFYGVSMGR
jgi:hypothetical protein